MALSLEIEQHASLSIGKNQKASFAEA